METRCANAVLLLVLLCLATSNVVLAEVLRDGTITTVKVRINATKNGFSVAKNATFGEVAATVTVNNTFLVTGWDVVTAEADSEFLRASTNSSEQLFLAHMAVGFGEGYTTYERMAASINNTFQGHDGLTNLLKNYTEAEAWVEKHITFMESMFSTKDTYGQQLRNFFGLLDGIVAGYNEQWQEGDMKLNRTLLFYLNFQTELGDVVTAVSPPSALEELRKKLPKYFTDLHCSALIKVVSNDIYFSHVTWSSFNSMMRQYKTYRFGDRFVTMSSYPGLIHSVDDWYMTHAKLAVMETTNGIPNDTLIRSYVVPESVSEFLRVMIANFLATDSPSWVQYFSRNNSGTYNNQWMVMNMGAVQNPDATLPPNTFWVAEQLPGHEAPLGITAADMTSHLNEKKFWASYNIPYFPNVFNISGNLKEEQQYGDFFSYKKYARARIFDRNQSDVVDLESMKHIMRYNNYKVDPLSVIPNCTGAGTNNTCNPTHSSMLTIASRGDLNPPGNTSNYGPLVQYVGRRDHGATDAKIATWSGMVKNGDVFTAHVICGPTNEEQPTFEWNNTLFDPMPPLYGLPKVYNFSFVSYTTGKHPVKPDTLNKRIGIAIGVTAAAAVLILIGILLYRSRQRAKELSEEESLLIQ